MLPRFILQATNDCLKSPSEAERRCTMFTEHRLAVRLLLAEMTREEAIKVLGDVYDRIEYLDRLAEWAKVGAN